MNIFSPRRDGLATFILLGCVCILLLVLNVVTSVQDWKRGKPDLLPVDVFYLGIEVFGAALCFLCARLVIRRRKQEWEEQEKFIAGRQASKQKI